jgi:predicted dehydrogenase
MSVKFGVIGPGTIGRFHAKAINEVEGAELVGVYGCIPGTGEEFAKEFGIAAATSLEGLLEQVDAVTIATPSGSHAECAVPAAEAGKHILCEKPLEVTPQKAQWIVDACRENGVLLAPVFQQRFGRAAQFLKKALDAGRFGRILFTSARIKWFRDQAYYDSGGWRGTWELDGGGCLMNQGIHTVDLMLWFGGRPSVIYGFTDTVTHTGIEVEDNACASFRFENGSMGTVEASTSCAPGMDAVVEMSGERGTAVLEGDRLGKWIFGDGDPLDEEADQLMADRDNLGSGASDPKAISIEGHKRQIADLVNSIENNTPTAIDPEEACEPIRFICAIYKSANEGRPVILH